MPHIKVAPFEISKLEELEFIKAIAKSSQNKKIALVSKEKEEFILLIKEDLKSFIIKPDKVSRPVNIELIKKTLSEIITKLHLKTLNSNISTSSKKPQADEKYKKSIKDFINFNPKNFEGVELEVGFGSGRHLLFQAKKRPKRLFIGVEIHTPSILQVLKQIKLQNLENIWIINYDARLLLEILPSNILDQIYVHFPVPWDKKPHRRVINLEFLNQAIRTLKVDGKLELRTDSKNYYYYSLEIFSSPKKVDFRVQKNRDLEIISKYEARWRRQNKDIYTLTFLNHQKSSPKELECTFEFDIKNLNLDSLKTKKEIFEDFFINIKEIYYTKDKKGAIVEISFGNFEKPEHKYLILEANKARYFPSIPVPTKASCKAHQKLKEILCQM